MKGTARERRRQAVNRERPFGQAGWAKAGREGSDLFHQDRAVRGAMRSIRALTPVASTYLGRPMSTLAVKLWPLSSASISP
jgi:hypothetical protein